LLDGGEGEVAIGHVRQITAPFLERALAATATRTGTTP
jgi:hypothetical protein